MILKQSLSGRRFVIISIFLAIGIIYVTRLIYLQLIDDSFIISANRNVLRELTVYPPRGLIYDRNGKLLTYNEAIYDLMVIPKQVRDFDTIEFCKMLNLPKEEFKSMFSKAYNYSPYKASVFEKQYSKEEYSFIEEKLYKYPGFYFQSRTLRKYPYPMAAHTLGYIGEVDNSVLDSSHYYKPGDYIGISGIEKSYEEVLRGKNGCTIMMVDNLNRVKGSFRDGLFDTMPIPGQNLYSSLDADLQAYGELLMKNKRGSIVAIEPSTGEILTIVTSPSYDPNLLVGRVRTQNYVKLSEDADKPLFNRALMAKYPPGSTFKLVNALVGLQEGVLKTATAFSCERGFHVGKLNVECHPHPSPLDLMHAIAVSCNAYFCKAFRAMIDSRKFHSVREGYETWRKLVMSFGLGEHLNTDLTSELRGNIPSANFYDKYHGKNRWKSLSIISLAIGQGEIGITPLQLANLASVIANRGYYLTPHIVKAIGNKKNLNPKFLDKKKTLVDAAYFNIVADAMLMVVEAGTASSAKSDEYKICGKTGTAQNPHGKNHSIFIAFAPKDNPKIAISVVIENAGFGATWAVPIASLMIEKYISGKITRPDVEESMINAKIY